jgi:hypothetical protein
MTAKTQLKKEKAMTTKKFLMTSLALGTLFLASASAHAQAIGEKLVYPGANCHKASGSSPGAGDPTYAQDGTLIYNGQSFLQVVCPMYDNGTTFTGDIWVVNNNSSGQAIVCLSIAGNPLESTLSSFSKVAFSSSAVQQLHFDAPAKGGTFTYRYYRCDLPSNSKIINYRGLAQ